VEKWLVSLLGESLWARLSQTARDQFKYGEFHYIVASKLEGEGGDFNSFVLCYSRGLLSEIHESLFGPLRKDYSLKGEYMSLFGETDHPEWPQLVRFICDLEKHADLKLVKRLLAQRVALDRLISQKVPFEMMKSCRNKAAHPKDRIDREEAAVLHNLLMNKGLIRSVVEMFPKVTRR
jgi:hypothetical protein